MDQRNTRDSALSPFGMELERLLRERGMSARQLADRVFVTASWLSKLKKARVVPADIARRCDEALEAQGKLIALAGSQGGLRPAQLPVVTARFVGRDSQIRQLTSVLAGRTRAGIPLVIAIDGLAGAGKTTLALRAAHDVAQRFPDGQLYIDLRGYAAHAQPVDPTHALEEFLAALGVQSGGVPGSIEQRAALYRSLLADKQILIVLDNAASSDQVLPLLPGSESCGVVVTSRKRLAGLALRTDARQLTLGPMTEEDAGRLLRGVIGAHRVDAEPEAVIELARRCEYLPLALRIAAERVASHPQLRVSDLVAELADADHLLDGLEADDSDAVRTVFSWSYRDLDPDAARMFRFLGLHRGPQISTGAAAALTGLSGSAARRVLERLANVHLVEGFVADRYRLHDLLRGYAAERAEAELPPPERRAAAGRLTTWYLHSAAAANRLLAPFRLNPLQLPPLAPQVHPITFGGQAEALHWCEGELNNFVPITKLAVDNEQFETAWKLAVALWDYLMLHKPGRVWIETHELALAAAQALGDRRAEGWVTTNLAEGLRWQREYERSMSLYDRAGEIRQSLGDHHGQAWVLAGTAFLAIDRDDVATALSRLQQALPIFRQEGDRHGEASMLFTLGDVDRVRGDLDEALRAFHDALAISADIEDQSTQATILTKIAEVYLARGDRSQALEYLDRSLAARRLVGDRWGEADTLWRRGGVLLDTGLVEQARQSWNAALALYAEVDDPRAADIRAQLATI